jgi:exodeoxyribonuclease VII large subunit
MTKDHSPSSLLEEINALLAAHYREPVWVQATLASVKVHHSNWSNWVVSDENQKLEVSLAPKITSQVSAELRKAGLKLKEGLALRILVRPAVSRLGRLQAELVRIDVGHSLSRSAPSPQEIYQDLMIANLADLQRKHVLTQFPFNLAVIGANGSDGITDALAVLETSNVNFRIATFDTPVQGAHAPGRIIDALQAVLRLKVLPDAVLLVRGGGARADLAAFDDRTLATFVCNYPIPVLTGIGHEADTTVCDLIAHHSERTPTGLATWVKDRVRENFAARSDSFDATLASLRERITAAVSAVDKRAALLARTNETLDAALHDLDISLERIMAAALTNVDTHTTSLDARDTLVKTLSDANLSQHTAWLATASATIAELHPSRALERGFAIVSHDGATLRSVPLPDSTLQISVAEGSFTARSS